MNGIALEKAFLPHEIEQRSFEIIESEIPKPWPWSDERWSVARRCIHALGDPEILPNLELPKDAFLSGLAAIRKGCEIFTDTRMLAAGLVQRRMAPLGIKVTPLMAFHGLEELAATKNTTRSAAAIYQIVDRLPGNIIAIGNAPTALLSLLDELDKRKAPLAQPALIIGMPVGFVNASQSKRLLAQSSYPFFTLHGRKGGSAVAAACVNALAELALAERK